MSTQFDPSEHPEWQHTCDVCFGNFPADKIEAHMREAHGIEKTEVVGKITQENGLLTIEDATGRIVVDVAQWLRHELAEMMGLSPVPNGIIEDTRSEVR